MPSPTWTPSALASEARPLAVDAWRMVEAQHVAATAKLLSDPIEQALLETMLDESKPPLPPEAAGLDYLLTTPWRYRPSHGGTRFRGETDPGTWYGAETVACAAAELGYWRSRFVAASEGLTRLDPVAHTAFRAAIATQTIDLRQQPLSRDESHWRHPQSYIATQALARSAREAAIGAIRYHSVRAPDDPPPWCIAVLRLDAFARRKPYPNTQTWFLTATRNSAQWRRATGGGVLAFRW